MKDLDPGRSGREDYNPETEGKPADRSTENNPGGMEGSPSDRDRNRGQQGSPSDRNRSQQGSQKDRNRDRGMQGSPSERDRDKDKGMGESQGERHREGGMREPNRGSTNDPSRAGSQSTEDELNDEDTAGEGGTRNRDASRGSDTDKHRKR
jgi:hypothetical protein